MLKRFLSLFLAVIMVAGMIPAMAMAAEEGQTPAAERVAIDATTKGDWENKYGTEAAILYGYVSPLTDEQIAGITDQYGRYSMKPADHTLVLKSSNSSLTSTSCDLNGNNIIYFSKRTDRPDTDAAVLELPASMKATNEKRLMQTIGRGYGKYTDTHGYEAYTLGCTTAGCTNDHTIQGTFTLNMADEEEHLISIYAYAPFQQDTYVTIFDLDGNVLLEDIIPKATFHEGAYVTYKAPGSVKILLENRNSNNDYGISGIFVDPVEPQEAPAAPTASYIGCDTETAGNWEGHYGNDTAILYGYAGTVRDDAEINKQKISLNTKYMSITPASWNATNTLLVQKDAQNSVLASQDFKLGGNNIYGHAGYFTGDAENPVWNSYAEDPAILNFPDGTTGTKFRIYASGKLRYNSTNPGFYGNLKRDDVDGGLYGIYDTGTNADGTVKSQTLQGRFELTFKDDGEHLISLYGYAPFKNQGSYPVIISLLDAEDNLLLRQAVPQDAFNSGAYMTFKASGKEIDIIVETRDCCNGFGIAGIFIDPVDSGEDPNPTPDPDPNPFAPGYTDQDGIYHLATDNVTHGNWEGVYGKDIAFLYGYAYDATAEVQKTDRFSVGHNKNDLVITRENLGYSFTHVYNSNGNLQCWAPGVNVTADAILNMPAGVARPEFETVAGSSNANNSPDYTYTFSDDSVHVLSVYNEHSGNGNVTITFVDPATSRELFKQTLPESRFAGGAYISYLVKGSVKVILTRTTAATSFSGVFVDALRTCPVSDLTAEAGTAPRSIKLTWTETDVPTSAKILVERKSADGAWELAATVDAGAGTYQDEGLQAGVSYIYRVRVKYAEADYSASSLTAKYDIPPYTQTVLALDEEEYVSDDTTKDITIKASLAAAGGEALAGQTVTLSLDFEHSTQELTAITDENGVATFTFKPDYLGLAIVSAMFADNDEASLMHSSAEATLYVGQTEWKAAPVIWSISDGILPGNLVSLNGYGMADVANLKVYYAPHGTAITAESATLPIINSDAAYGYYVIAQLPEDAQPGLYDLVVANSYGMSEIMTLNIARPLFIDEYEAWNGQTIMLSGRNLEGAQFGYHGTTKLRLVSGGEAIEQTITKLTPYSIRFTVSGTVGTTYKVEVSNNGGTTWVELDSKQTLTVVEEGLDPLGLGVAWADHFNWDAAYLKVTDFGAKAGDDIDDTAAFQAALNAAGAQTGGGVVFVPNGTYLVGNIQMSAYTVLMGESTEKTVLKYYNPNANNGGGNMFSNTAEAEGIGQIGLANFSVRMYDDAVRPDTFLWLGHRWGTANKDQTTRTAKEMFVSGVDIEYSYAPAQQRGLGMVFLADERVIIQNSSFVGYSCNTQSCYVNDYCRYIGNYYSFDRGAVGSVANYNFVLDCTVNDVNRDPGEDNHAFMMRQTTHWEGNWVEGTGNQTNVGEAFCVEMPGGVFAIGQVIDATANTVTALFPNQNPDPFVVMYGRIAVTITSGKGMGQVRDIASYDLTTGKIVLAEDWDVLPDATSRFTITCPLDRVTVYNNGMDDNTKGIFMYGNGYDNVVANNYLEDSEGIFIYSSDVLPLRSTPNYFTTVRDNVLNGPGVENSYVNISVRSNRPSGGGGTYFCTAIYAIEVRNNILIGDGTQPPASNCSEANIANGLSSNSAVNNGSVGTDGVFGDNLDIIWENNELQHLSHGFEVSKADYGFAYKGNVLIDVEKILKNEVKPGQNVTGLSNAELAAAPAVTKAILENYVSLYKDPAAISGYTEEMAALLAKVVAQAEAILADSASDAFDYAFAMTRLRIAASMREIPLGGEEIQAILLSREACIDCADNDGDGICDACGHVFAVAVIGTERYGTLQAAVDAAKAGDTILLVTDQTVDALMLTKGVTVDLGGHTLESAYMIAFNGNAIIDSIGGGLLKSKNVRLAADNAQMPVWVEEDGGYRFFTMKDSQLYYSQSESGFVFIAKPVLGKAANAPYMALANNGLSVKARMSWKSAAGNDVEQFFVLKGEDVQKIYSDTNQIIQLTVNGAGSYIGRLSTTIVIESETGVIWAGVPLLYTGN